MCFDFAHAELKNNRYRPMESSHNVGPTLNASWDETLVKRTLLINLGRVSCINYFMSMHIVRFSDLVIKTSIPD